MNWQRNDCAGYVRVFRVISTSYTDSGSPEQKIKHGGTSPGPGSCYRCHPPNMFRSGLAKSRKKEHLGFPENFEAQELRAHVPRRARTPAPGPRSTPLMSPRSFVSQRRKTRGNLRSRTRLHSSHVIVREGAEHPANICIML